MREQRFEYRLPKTTALLGVVLGLALAIGGVLAIVKDWGLSVFGAVPLDSEYVWVVFAALVAIGVPLAIASFRMLGMGRREVVVTEAMISVPKGETSRAIVEIPTKSIRQLGLQQAQGVTTLLVKHDRGNLKLRSPHFGEHFGALVASIVEVTGLELRH